MMELPGECVQNSESQDPTNPPEMDCPGRGLGNLHFNKLITVGKVVKACSPRHCPAESSGDSGTLGWASDGD